MENQNIIEKALSYSPSKEAKIYSLSMGSFPEGNSKATPFGIHASILASAILSMIDEGKVKATRKEICEKAVELGLYKAKASKSSPDYIFSWWLKALKANNFLA